MMYSVSEVEAIIIDDNVEMLEDYIMNRSDELKDEFVFHSMFKDTITHKSINVAKYLIEIGYPIEVAQSVIGFDEISRSVLLDLI